MQWIGLIGVFVGALVYVGDLADPPCLVARTKVLEQEVKVFQALAFGNWPEHVVLDETTESLNPAFLIAFGWCSELHFERQGSQNARKASFSSRLRPRKTRVTAVLALSKTPTRGMSPKCTTAPKIPAKSAS